MRNVRLYTEKLRKIHNLQHSHMHWLIIKLKS